MIPNQNNSLLSNEFVFGMQSKSELKNQWIEDLVNKKTSNGLNFISKRVQVLTQLKYSLVPLSVAKFEGKQLHIRKEDNFKVVFGVSTNIPDEVPEVYSI